MSSSTMDSKKEINITQHTIVGLVILVGLFVVSRLNFLLFHSLAELFAVVVAWSLFLLVWNTRKFVQNDAMLFLGIAYLSIALIDVMHTLSYKGMEVFPDSLGANCPTQLWIAARGLEAVSLLLFPLLINRRIRPWFVLGTYTAVTALIMAAIFAWHIFPDCYIEGSGLTAFKKAAEYIISLIIVCAIVLLFRIRNQLDTTVFRVMVGAMAVTIVAELSFTFYVSVYGLSNIAGHFFKIISFFLVYMALVRSSLTRPYVTLFRDLEKEKVALRESEESASKKIQAILEPKGDIGALSLADIIDHPSLQSMMEEFYNITKIGSAVLDLSGKVIVAVGWQDICTIFHRCHPATLKNCIESDASLSDGVPVGKFKAYRCKNNLWDMVTPIEVGGRHVGNIFLGQFFYEDEMPDYDLFRRQARQYGFNEKQYLAALDRVPRWSRETVDATMKFYAKLAGMISSLSYSTVNLARAISQQATTLRKLRESERNLRKAQRIAGMGDFTWDIATGSVTWSDGMYSMLKYDRNETIGLEMVNTAIHHPNDLERVTKWLMDGVVSGKEFLTPNEYRLIRKDGQTTHVQVNGQIEHSGGKAVMLFGTCLDITERKVAEESLRGSEERNRTILQTAMAGFWRTDQRGRLLEVNDAYCRMSGYSAKELLAMQISDLEAFETDNDTAAHIKKTMAQGEDRFETRHRRKDGSVFDIEISAQYRPAEGGQFVAFLQDITERKLAELEREATISILKILNAGNDLHGLMATVMGFMRELAGCEAVGIRLRDGSDFPYYNTSGFSDEFVKAEMHLCVKDLDGQLKRDEVGNPVLECMCGNIICGRFDPSKPFFTEFGSFISNCTTELLANTTEEDRQARTRNRCNGEGYESVFLVPLRAGNETFGLLQFNDRRKGSFPPQLVAKVERLAGNVAFALAQRKAEDALKKAELFLENISDIAYRADNQGNLVWVNPAIERITGHSREDHIGKPFIPLFIEADQASLIDVYKRTLMGESLENTLTFTSGATCHFTSLPYHSENGDIVGTFGVARDMTAQLDAQRALAVSEDRLKKAQATAKIGNWEYDVSTGLVWGSKEAFRIYGIERTSEYLPLDEVESHIVEAGRVNQALVDLVTKGENYDIEFQITQKNSKGLIIIHSIAELVKDEEGNPVKVIGVIQDITDKKAKEEENTRLIGHLQQAQKMESIGNLAGGIAHDFNNILFPIVGMSEMLMEDLPSGSPEHESAQEIFKAGRRASDLVKQILAFSRQTVHQMMPVRVQQVLKEVIKLTRSAIPSDIKVSQYLQSDCGLVIANPTQLHQIAMNLITNAFHAVEQTGGKISITLKETVLGSDDLPSSLEPGNYAMISVADTGCGIDPNVVGKIFEPYFTTKEQGKGTGIGLAVVYGIVKEHGGDIRVYSEIGKGTTFNVYLPLAVKHVDQASRKTVEIHQTGTERILLVDDEEPIVRLEMQMLERLGYRVTTRNNSLEALEAFKANPDAYDLVISDMTMPNMTGDQLARKLIAIRPNIPIIICTGFSERLNEGTADAIGTKGFLMKPVVKSEMAQMVRTVLDGAKGTIR